MLFGLVSVRGQLPCFYKGGQTLSFSLMLHSSCFHLLNGRAQTDSDDFNVTAGRPQGVTMALVVVSNGSGNGGGSSRSSNTVVVVAAAVVVVAIVNSHYDEQDNSKE